MYSENSETSRMRSIYSCYTVCQSINQYKPLT